jgi:hypothetical protein
MLLACVRRPLFADHEHISFVTSPVELRKIIPKQREVVKLFGARRVW